MLKSLSESIKENENIMLNIITPDRIKPIPYFFFVLFIFHILLLDNKKGVDLNLTAL